MLSQRNTQQPLSLYPFEMNIVPQKCRMPQKLHDIPHDHFTVLSYVNLSAFVLFVPLSFWNTCVLLFFYWFGILLCFSFHYCLEMLSCCHSSTAIGTPSCFWILMYFRFLCTFGFFCKCLFSYYFTILSRPSGTSGWK